MRLTWLQNGELLYLQSRISSALTADFSPNIVRNFRLQQHSRGCDRRSTARSAVMFDLLGGRYITWIQLPSATAKGVCVEKNTSCGVRKPSDSRQVVAPCLPKVDDKMVERPIHLRRRPFTSMLKCNSPTQAAERESRVNRKGSSITRLVSSSCFLSLFLFLPVPGVDTAG